MQIAKKRIRRLADTLIDTQNEYQDLLYLQQKLMLESGIAISVSDEEEFETLVEVMSAKAKEDRPVTPREALRRLRGK